MQRKGEYSSPQKRGAAKWLSQGRRLKLIFNTRFLNIAIKKTPLVIKLCLFAPNQTKAANPANHTQPPRV